MTDLYRKIYDGEIFQATQCIWHENTLMDFFRSQLRLLGYTPISENSKVWQRGNKKVVVCLVDDFATCSKDFSTELPHKFDKDTVVITDNYTAVPTQYTVLRLPPSFFGIYSHRPVDLEWRPDRRINFSVNRLDSKRMLVLLEIWNRCMMINPDLSKIGTMDYINFNCWSWSSTNDDPGKLKENFTREWLNSNVNVKEAYQHVYNDLLPRMPLVNHDLTHEQSHVSAWVNVVMETYSSDTTIALSEKIFRALCLPVPWTTFSGKYTVAYLHSLGFDVLYDLIEHRYDGMIENRTVTYGDKVVDFVFESTDAANKLKTQNFEQVQKRCAQAAEHNRKLLLEMQQQWPVDFARWLPEVMTRIS